MILILTSSGDSSTDHVIDWLNFYKYPFIRINADDLLNDQLFISIVPPRIVYRKTEIDLKDVNAVWFRKFGNFRKTNYFKKNEGKIREDCLYQLSREFNALLGSVASLLRDKYWLTNSKKATLNKLHVLNIASKTGLDIPETFVLNDKKELLELINKGDYISKSIYEPLFFKSEEGMYSMLTKNIRRVEAEFFSENFFPSLIQKKVEKEFELRIFYIDSQFYPMAIFSQYDDSTKVDFRNYNLEKPNRWIPYVLPKDQVKKLDNFMFELGLNCGSIDMIKSQDGKFYFLEVNPTGQFGMVSNACNYDLHHVVASHLIEKDKKYEKKEIH